MLLKLRFRGSSVACPALLAIVVLSQPGTVSADLITTLTPNPGPVESLVTEGQSGSIVFTFTNVSGPDIKVACVLASTFVPCLQFDQIRASAPKLIRGEAADEVDSTDIPAMQDHCFDKSGQGVTLGKGGTCKFELHFTTLDADNDKDPDLDFGTWKLTVLVISQMADGTDAVSPMGTANVDVRDPGAAPPPPVPEPATLLLLGSTLALFAARRLGARGHNGALQSDGLTVFVRSSSSQLGRGRAARHRSDFTSALRFVRRSPPCRG
jgi:hypothetical protein